MIPVRLLTVGETLILSNNTAVLQVYRHKNNPPASRVVDSLLEFPPNEHAQVYNLKVRAVYIEGQPQYVAIPPELEEIMDVLHPPKELVAKGYHDGVVAGYKKGVASVPDDDWALATVVVAALASMGFVLVLGTLLSPLLGINTKVPMECSVAMYNSVSEEHVVLTNCEGDWYDH